MNLYYQVFRHLLRAMGLLLLLLSLLLTHLLTQLTVHVITVKLPSTPTIDILYASNWLVSLVHALITTVVGLVLLHESDLVLMEVELPLLYPYGWLSLGYWLYDLVSLASLANKDSPQALPARLGLTARVQRAGQQVGNLLRWWPGMVGHHLGVITFLWVAVLNTDRQRGDGMVAASFIMELSSVFVAARSALAKLGFKNTSLYLWMSVCMVATFLLARIVLLPGVIYLYSMQQGLTMLQGMLSMPRQCVIGTVMFYGLNCYWFSLMVRGCVRLVTGSRKKTELEMRSKKTE